MTRWTDAESDDLDRQIRANRRAEEIARKVKKRKPNSGVGSFDYDGSGRGRLTREEEQRRRKADRAIRERADRRSMPRAARRRPWPLPDPKPTTSGRWRARVVHQGRVYIKTFDSRAEAVEFIKQVTSTDEGKE